MAIAMLFAIWFVCGKVGYLLLKKFHYKSAYTCYKANPEFPPHQIPVYLVYCSKYIHKGLHVLKTVGNLFIQSPIWRYRTRNYIQEKEEVLNNGE